MSAPDLVIRGGTICTASERYRAGLAVTGGKITRIAASIEGGREEIDATGLLVLPGGIDADVHLAQEQGGGTVMADDFVSGTRSAVAGGNTTVLPFALQKRGQSLREAVSAYHAQAERHDAIKYMTRKLEEQGETAPYYHAEAHAQIAEREATHRAISHAQLADVPIVIVHVSGRGPKEQIQWAQARGLRVFAETCPQYIALTADDLKGLNMDFEGAKYVCSPPPRDTDSQTAIWQGLRDGTFDLFSSDHCPFYFEGEGGTGKDNPRARTSFKWVPYGIPGVETRLPILFSEGVSKGRITLERFVVLTSTNPA